MANAMGGAVEGVCWLVGLRSRAEDVAVIARGQIKRTGLRTVGGGQEVGCAQRAGTHSVAVECRRGVFIRDGPSLDVFGVTTGLLAVRGSGDQLAGGAIQNVEEAIAIGLYDQVLVSGIEHHR